ncbi:hypothetical protein NEPAR07_2341 [Nematocida parisii]|nr:hypothetical protein NEPAR07_2341 [Nematocida parisii]
MLKDSIKQKEKEKLNVEVEYLKSIIDKCFVKSNDNITNDNGIHVLNAVYGNAILDNAFPFSGSIDIPGYRAILSYNRKKDSFNVGKGYSNCVEAGLLGLFCCLAYDAETKEYTTEHMGEVSPDLKRFFTIYNKPFETDTYDIHKEWNKVVADLENENIKYLKEDRNELVSGIINMLYVITEITGRYSKEEESLKEFCARLEMYENQSKLFNDIKSYISELFISLSTKYSLDKDSKIVKRTIKIDTSNMSIKESIIKHPDIFGSINITYSVSEFEGGITIENSNIHLSIKTFYNENSLNLINLNQTYINNTSLCTEGEKNNTLTDYLIVRCIKHPQDNKILERRFKKLHPENINISEENNYLYPIEKLFLYNKFKKAGNTAFMVHYIRECLIGHPFEENSPWARLISNLLGSLPLNDYNIIFNILFSPLYKGGLYKNCFQKITAPSEIDNVYYKYIIMYGIHYHLIYCNSLKRILQILKAYISMGDEIGNYLLFLQANLLEKNQIRLLSLLTCGGENITYLLEIAEFIDNLDRNDPRYTNTLTSNDMWALWFRMAFNSDIFISIIKSIFDKINSEEENIHIEFIKRFNFSDLRDSKKIANFLRDLINKSPETREKFYYAVL